MCDNKEYLLVAPQNEVNPQSYHSFSKVDGTYECPFLIHSLKE